MGDALGGGVGAMRRAEGIVHVEVGEAGEGLGELGVVLGLPRLEAAVLEQQDLFGGELPRHPGDVVADDRGRLLHLQIEQIPEPPADGGHGEGRVGSLWAAEMRDEDDARPGFSEQLDGRQRGPDPGVVGDRAALERHVQISAQQDPAAVDIRVPDARLAERA
jgi:hypothetical protein